MSCSCLILLFLLLFQNDRSSCGLSSSCGSGCRNSGCGDSCNASCSSSESTSCNSSRDTSRNDSCGCGTASVDLKPNFCGNTGGDCANCSCNDNDTNKDCPSADCGCANNGNPSPCFEPARPFVSYQNMNQNMNCGCNR